MAIDIHPTAVVDKAASIADGVAIGPYCLVGPKAAIGKGTRLRSHVVVEGSTSIGENCDIYPFACLGQAPQDMKYKGEDTSVKIGNNNIIREYVTVHRASVGGDGITSVGDDNFFMAYVHVAHDCKVGSHVIMANYAGLAGHVIIEDRVVIGGLLGVHQYVRVGAYSMLGGMSRIVNDVPPFMIVSGAEKAKLYGLNVIGLKRNGFSDESIEELKQAYNILFRQKLTIGEAIKKVQADLPYTEHIKHLIEFIKENKRGITR